MLFTSSAILSLVLKKLNFQSSVFNNACTSKSMEHRSGSSVVVNTVNYQSRDHKINPLLLWFSDKTLNRDTACLLMTLFLVGG